MIEARGYRLVFRGYRVDVRGQIVESKCIGYRVEGI